MDQLSTLIILLLLHLISCINCQDWHFQGPNVAMGKIATQSPATYENFTADLAVDGNTGTTLYKDGEYLCTHTYAYRRNQGAHWTVDLGVSFVIKGIRIYNREDEVGNKKDYIGRLRNFTVTGIPTAPDAAELLYNDSASQPQLYLETIINITVTSQTPFRRITVAIPPRPYERSYLTLCEVEIFPVLCEIPTVGPPLLTQLVASTGTIIQSQYATPQTQLRFSCQTGLHLKFQGAPTLTCQDDGNYDYRAPTCEKMTPCPKPPIRSHVRYISIKSELYPGDSVSWSCEAGFSPQTSQQLTCSQSSTWSGTPPSCSPMTCPHPGPLQHGHYIDQLGRSYTVGSVAVETSLTVSCSTGYTPSIAVIRCTQTSYNASWDKTANCTQITCRALDETRLNGGRYNYTTTNMGSQGYGFGTLAKAICPSDFTSVGEETLRTCGESGTWSGTPSYCELVSQHQDEETQSNPITVIAGTGAGGVLLGIVIVALILVVYKRRVQHGQNDSAEDTPDTQAATKPEATALHEVNTYLNTAHSLAVANDYEHAVANDYEQPSRPDSQDKDTYATIQDVQYENV